MMNAYGTEENSAKFPFLQLGNKKKNNPIYINEMNFWTALELSKINGKVKKDYQKDPKNRCVVSDGISFYFPSDGSNNRLIENGVNKIYQSGYGENNDLTLAQTEQGYLRFVKTNALLTLPKNGFKLVNNIWIGTDYTEKKLNKLDSNISKTYRQFYSYGFTQYHYINNKWTKQFEISYKKSKNNLKIQKIVDDKTKTIDNKNILSDLTEYLYKPANYFS